MRYIYNIKKAFLAIAILRGVAIIYYLQLAFCLAGNTAISIKTGTSIACGRIFTAHFVKWHFQETSHSNSIFQLFEVSNLFVVPFGLLLFTQVASRSGTVGSFN